MTDRPRQPDYDPHRDWYADSLSLWQESHALGRRLNERQDRALAD